MDRDLTCLKGIYKLDWRLNVDDLPHNGDNPGHFHRPIY